MKAVTLNMADGFAAPLRYSSYRTIWITSIFANFGLLIQGVGAAWLMTQLTTSAHLVALVPAAAWIPSTLLALPAGAASDMYDRRITTMAGVALALLSATLLALAGYYGMLVPMSLLTFCFLIGCGVAIFTPCWQTMTSELVPAHALPAAVALNSVSFNLARSFGPALGGLAILALGTTANFVINAVFYLPLLVALALWKRKVEPTRLPPEALGRAVWSGVRYIAHTPLIRVLAFRALLLGVIGGSMLALMPLIARDLVGGGAGVFGFLVGCFGLGAVRGATMVSRLQKEGRNQERTILILLLLLAAAMLVTGFSRSLPLTSIALLLAGACWMTAASIFNITMQTGAPRWVSGRVVAAYQAAITGGAAIGGWGWGGVADQHGTGTALLIAGCTMLLYALVGRWLPMPRHARPTANFATSPSDPEVNLPITARSGPIVIELEYEVDPGHARAFYTYMQTLRRVRQRNGGYGWTLSRDIAAPRLWTERFHCPTWMDYLRQRDRVTEAERELNRRATIFHIGSGPVRVTRKLERPFGSVRWNDAAPDPQGGEAVAVSSAPGP